MTQDNLGNTYSYDAEGRQIAAAGVDTTFDAFGRAWEQNRNGSYTQIVYSPSGAKFAFMNGQTLIKYIDPMVAGMAAVHNGPNGNPPNSGYFQHADWLGSSRLAHDGNGNVIYDREYAPFGEPYSESTTANRNFTGQTEDTTPGIYDFLFRQQSQSQGRWMVPDPAGLAAVDITNPQTWNRYAYLANNPLNAIDPQGLYKRTADDISIPLPTFCPGVLGCGSSFGGSLWGSGDSSDPNGGFPDNGAGYDDNGNPNCGTDCGPTNEPGFLGTIANFYSGAYSGVPTQMQMNNWSAQQFWQGRDLQTGSQTPYARVAQVTESDPNYAAPSLWSYLPQNQNPGAQSASWESQNDARIGHQRFGSVYYAVVAGRFPGGLPNHYSLGPTKFSYGISQCIQQNPNNVMMCIQGF